MVRIINIDTKARTIRVSNGKDDLEWFTTDTGSHVPLKKGQSKAEAIKEHFGDKKDKVSGKAIAAAKKEMLARQAKERKALRDSSSRLGESYYKQRVNELIKQQEIEEQDFYEGHGIEAPKAKQQPAKKVKETYADTSEIDGAEVFKDGDDYVVLYANGTKTREFSSKTEADKFAKSLSKQPVKKAEQPAKEEKNDHTERDLNKIPISQMTPAEKKYMWDLEQKKYKETQKNIAKDTIVGLRKMIEKTNKLIANFEKNGQQAEVDGLIGYRDELEKSIKEITKIHRL